MANKKRSKHSYSKQLGRYRLKRADMLVIEKILWSYADICEMKHAGVSKMPDGRKHMSRTVVDRHVSIGRYRPFHIGFGMSHFSVEFAGVDWIYQEDSVKFLSKAGYPKRTRYMEFAAWPGIKVTFTPLSTTIYAQTHYATGKELKAMKETVESLGSFIESLQRSYVNTCRLGAR